MNERKMSQHRLMLGLPDYSIQDLLGLTETIKDEIGLVCFSKGTLYRILTELLDGISPNDLTRGHRAFDHAIHALGAHRLLQQYFYQRILWDVKMEGSLPHLRSTIAQFHRLYAWGITLHPQCSWQGIQQAVAIKEGLKLFISLPHSDRAGMEWQRQISPSEQAQESDLVHRLSCVGADGILCCPQVLNRMRANVLAPQQEIILQRPFGDPSREFEHEKSPRQILKSTLRSAAHYVLLEMEDLTAIAASPLSALIEVRRMIAEAT